MTIANTSWNRTGTISIEANATKVYGTNTQWLTAGINSGATLRIDGTFYALEILAVVSDTEIDLRVAYTGETVTNVTYSIDRNFQSTMNAQLAAGVAAMTGKYEKHIDDELKQIEGESAYDIAVKNGYTGTQAEWLESLKAAGEWSNANTRLTTAENKITTLETLRKNCGILAPNISNKLVINYILNSQPLFRNLGSTIDWSMLYSSSNHDLDNCARVGDYWELGVGRAIVAHILGENYYYIALAAYHTPLSMNDTATTTGGYKASKMYTEYLPALLADVEAEIGAEHLTTFRTSEESSNTPDSYGETHGSGLNPKIDLFRRIQLIRDPHFRGDAERPLALWQLAPTWGEAVFTGISNGGVYWLQDVDEYNSTTNFLCIRSGEIMMSQAANATNYTGWGNIFALAQMAFCG